MGLDFAADALEKLSEKMTSGGWTNDRVMGLCGAVKALRAAECLLFDSINGSLGEYGPETDAEIDAQEERGYALTLVEQHADSEDAVWKPRSGSSDTMPSTVPLIA